MDTWLARTLSTLHMVKLTVSKKRYNNSLKSAMRHTPTKEEREETNSSTISLEKAASSQPRRTAGKRTLLQLAYASLCTSEMTLLNYF